MPNRPLLTISKPAAKSIKTPPQDADTMENLKPYARPLRDVPLSSLSVAARRQAQKVNRWQACVQPCMIRAMQAGPKMMMMGQFSTKGENPRLTLT